VLLRDHLLSYQLNLIPLLVEVVEAVLTFFNRITQWFLSHCHPETEIPPFTANFSKFFSFPVNFLLINFELFLLERGC
jgi:hypothetical protein